MNIFEENVNYWLTQCHEDGTQFTYIEAKNRAIDYWRKFTRKEILIGGVDADSGMFTSESELGAPLNDISYSLREKYAEDTFDMEAVFHSIFPLLKKKERMLFCLLLRKADVVQYLSSESQNLIDELVGDEYPETFEEVAIALGYSVRGNGSCSALDYLRSNLKDSIFSMGLVDEFEDGLRFC